MQEADPRYRLCLTAAFITAVINARTRARFEINASERPFRLYALCPRSDDLNFNDSLRDESARTSGKIPSYVKNWNFEKKNGSTNPLSKLFQDPPGEERTV